MSSEVKIKIEPGSSHADVAGSVGHDANARSASHEHRGELMAEVKVKVEHDPDEYAVARALSFSSEETKTEDNPPPKPKKPSRIELKNAQLARRVAKREEQARLKEAAQNSAIQPEPEAQASSPVVEDPGSDYDSKRPYRPDLVSPFAASNSSVILWHAGQLALLSRKHKILKPLKIRLPARIWGPVPKPEFGNIEGGDRDLAMSFVVHTLLCGGFIVKQEDLPVTDNGEPYYRQFTFEDIRATGMAVFNALASLVGSTLSNFTPRPGGSLAGSNLGSLTTRLKDVRIQDPYASPVKDPVDDELDVVMESPEPLRVADPTLLGQIPHALESRPSRIPMLPGSRMVTIKSKDQVAREKAEKAARSAQRKAQSKRSKMSKYQSASDSDGDQEDPYDEVYLGVDSDDEQGHTPRIRAASTLEVKNFSGRDMDPERARSWLNRLSLKGRRDGLAPMEMRDLFSDHLVQGAKSWYQQLPKSVRRDWSSIVEEFQFQYCEKGVKPAEQYYTMTRRSDELPLEYLYRLNVAAAKAHVPIYRTFEHEKAHLDRFIRSVEDDDLVRSMSFQRVQSVKALEASLKELARYTRRNRDRDQDPRSANEKNLPMQKQKFPAKKWSMDPGSKEKPIAVKSVRKGSRHVDKMDLRSGGSDSDGGSDSSDDESDAGDDSGSSEDERYGVYQVASTQEFNGSKSRPACKICGSSRHSVSDCWRNIQCDHCKRMGHPSDRCRERCRACKQLHDYGECEFEAFFNRVNSWYNPARHAGLLPTEVEEALN